MTSLVRNVGRASPALAICKELKYDQLQQAPIQRELLILLSLRASKDNGVYGLDIQRAIQECSGGAITISHGSLYTLLKRLRAKKYINSYEGDALGGGAKRHYYYLTESGQSLVAASNAFFNNLQNWTPE